jgi:hypothetical protein
MNEPLEIPDAAWTAYHEVGIEDDDLRAAAPLIVAARLRHLIKDLEQEQESLTGGAEVDGLGIAIITLQLDVDQFDPHELTA